VFVSQAPLGKRSFVTQENNVKRTSFIAGVVTIALPLAALTIGSAQAQTAVLDKGLTVSGQGSTFVSNLLEQCRVDAKNEFGINVAYQGTGSGAGRNAYIAGTNDFGASDVAFPSVEVEKAKSKPFVYVPVAVGGIAVIYKISGLTDLKLSGPTLAGIFAGKIQKWDAEPIVKDNPGVNLPSDIIRVIVRSDSSGTSNVFSDYLGTVGKGAWTAGTTSNFPVPAGNGVAQRGSDGVTNYVAGSQGNFSITYAEASFAEERKLPVVKVINAAGNAIAPEASSITEAMSAAAVNDDGTVLLNFQTPSPKAYPISTTAYVIAPQTMDKAKGDILRTFLTFTVGACQKKADKVGYAPLPANLVKLGTDAIAKINPGSAAVPLAAGAAPAPAASVPAATVPVSATSAPTTVAAKTSTSTPKKPVVVKKKTRTTKK
jgi:phosphate transport system substrate-binding protein